MATLLDGLKNLLPRQVREQLTLYFYEKLRASQLDCYLNPMYRYVDALKDIDALDSGWVQSVSLDCYTAAEKLYEERHPKKWEHGTAYREYLLKSETTPKCG